MKSTIVTLPGYRSGCFTGFRINSKAVTFVTFVTILKKYNKRGCLVFGFLQLFNFSHRIYCVTSVTIVTSINIPISNRIIQREISVNMLQLLQVCNKVVTM